MLIALLDPTPLLRPSFFSIGCGQEKFYYFTCNILTVRIATDKIMLALPVPPGRGVSLIWNTAAGGLGLVVLALKGENFP